MGIDIFSLDLDLAAEHSALLLLSVVLLLGIAAFLSVKRRTPSEDTKEKEKDKDKEREKEKERAPGEWTPKQFRYPDFPSCSLSLSEIKPIPYRPFRWGQYNVTMGIRNMPWEDWIELDDQFDTYHRIRERRIRAQGENVVRVLPAGPVVGSGAPAGKFFFSWVYTVEGL
ncbi:hypothetical protein IW261DRAFT_18657 [Armillaria novae-zelandiae]|uniref:Uncharacterized protein n=1 Tax=Armillaria novae-zelandiae TaxID=153914 RepID=A0AA39UNK4_9AGAR|nr:hypothetical protein IW261DRAFT_18657 [Armillaria novae-zelandiae]